MLNASLAIALGGAIGSVLRHGVNVASAKMLGTDFPYGTLTVNLVGSFVMGLLFAVFAHVWQPPQGLRLFLVTGVLGGFTTFSSFSLDAVTLLERQDYLAAGLYILTSVALSLVALFAAMIVVRSIAI